MTQLPTRVGLGNHSVKDTSPVTGRGHACNSRIHNENSKIQMRPPDIYYFRYWYVTVYVNEYNYLIYAEYRRAGQSARSSA